MEIEPPDVPAIIAASLQGQHIYAHGADWAKQQDFTEIVNLRTDVSPMRIVAYQRIQKHPWPFMIGLLNTRMERYPGPARHDQTGLGDVVGDYLSSTESEGVILKGSPRDQILMDYTVAIESHLLKSAKIAALHAQHLYASVDDLYGKGHLPDGICASALAYLASKSGTGVFVG